MRWAWDLGAPDAARWRTAEPLESGQDARMPWFPAAPETSCCTKRNPAEHATGFPAIAFASPARTGRSCREKHMAAHEFNSNFAAARGNRHRHVMLALWAVAPVVLRGLQIMPGGVISMRNPPSVSPAPPRGGKSSSPICTSDTTMVLPFAARVNNNAFAVCAHKFGNALSVNMN